LVGDELDPAFEGEGVGGEAAGPEGDLEADGLVRIDLEEFEVNGEFEDAAVSAVGGFGLGGVVEEDGAGAGELGVEFDVVAGAFNGDADFEAGVGAGAFFEEVEAEVELGAVGAVEELAGEELLSVHGALALVGAVQTGAEPFEVAGDFAFDAGDDEAGGRFVGGGGGDFEDGTGEFLWGDEAEGVIDVGEVGAEEFVEFGAVFGVVFGAIPPVPVGAFGDEKFLVGELAHFPGEAFAFGCVEELLVGLAGVEEEIPGAVVLFGADPDIEVGVDPGTGMDAGEFGGGEAVEGFGNGDGGEGGILGDALVEVAEEGASVAIEVFPGVFAVEDDGDEGVLALVVEVAGVFADAVEEVVGGVGGVHAGVNEADEIAEEVVAEKEFHFAAFVTPNPGAAGFLDAGGAHEGGAEDAVVGGHPLDTEIGSEGEGFVGDGTFGRPEAFGGESELLFGVVAGGLDLVAGVLGEAEAAGE